MSGYTPPTSNEPDLMPPSTLQNYIPPTPTDIPGPADIQNAVAAYAQRKLAAQPWWKKSSNTVTTSIGGVLTMGAWMVSSGLAAPMWLQFALGILGLIGTILGVKSTPNGFTYRGAANIIQATADPVVLGTIQKTLSQEPFPMHVQTAIDTAAREAKEWIDATGNGQR